MDIPGAFSSSVKCQCCRNPWNSKSGDDNDRGLVCAPCIQDSKGFSGFDPENLDPAESPKDNFYLWSNGGWRKRNPIPPEYSSWNTFTLLRDLNFDRLKDLLHDLQSNSSLLAESGEKKLNDFFSSFMDEEEIERRGIEPLIPALSMAANANVDPTTVIANLQSQFGISTLFRIYSSPDKKNSEHTLAVIWQGGLGLPDRDYYFDADKEEKRQAYIDMIENFFLLLGENGVAPYNCADVNERIAMSKMAANQVFNFEKELAESHLTRTLCRDAQLTYNKMSIAALQELVTPPLSWASYLARGVNDGTKRSCFDWSRYWEIVGKPVSQLGDVNVACVDAIKKASVLCFSPALPHYLAFHIVLKNAKHLPRSFTDLHFRFFEKTLQGTTEIKARFKRGLEIVEEALGFELGKLYVRKYFPDDSKARALRIVELVRDALRERILELDWMSPDTKKSAMLKMERFAIKIGFPDESAWVDYSDLKIAPGKHMENWLAAQVFAFNLELKRMNAKTDRKRWLMTPQTVNAYYHPSLNEIVFPAAILQPPFFDPKADDAMNFGSMGCVVGHEMTHGFDDEGRKYDFEGTLRDWWGEKDAKEYEERAMKMIKQAEEFEVYGIKLKGKLTCGENIADLGGVKLSLRALNKELSKRSSPVELINGFTPRQRFFLSWSQAWRENVKKERALSLVTLDPHGPNEFRCNGTLSNVQEFFDEFGITSGDKMFRDVEDRVDIW